MSKKRSLTEPEQSALMSRVRAKNTKPEVTVRRLLHSFGYRFRLHRRDLPGSPDIVLPKHRVAIFVHGCFWHQHRGCRLQNLPAKNLDYWLPKLRRTKLRDRRSLKALTALGWHPLVLWECETRPTTVCATRLQRLLDEVSVSD